MLGLILISTVGCVNSSQTKKKNTDEYQVTLLKSSQNISIKKYQGKEQELTLLELLAKSGTQFKTDMHDNKEVLTELDGVISTASRSWNVYINDSKQAISVLNEIKINSQNEIKIIYEENK